jgi:hypothetical protein
MSAKHVKITFPECADITARLLAHFWESKMDAKMLADIQADWYKVLQHHSMKTVDKVAIEWLSIGKRKPTPADILELCNEIDSVPQQLDRFRTMYELPVKDQVNEEWQPDGKMNGDPNLLSKLMRFSQNNEVKFNEKDQLDYLSNGIVPTWYVQEPTEQRNKDMPSREELLAQMSPEARLAAIKPNDAWR